jgi:hypothetical protein
MYSGAQSLRTAIVETATLRRPPRVFTSRRWQRTGQPSPASRAPEHPGWQTREPRSSIPPSTSQHGRPIASVDAIPVSSSAASFQATIFRSASKTSSASPERNSMAEASSGAARRSSAETPIRAAERKPYWPAATPAKPASRERRAYIIGTCRRIFGSIRSRIRIRLGPVTVIPWLRSPITASFGFGSAARSSATLTASSSVPHG